MTEIHNYERCGEAIYRASFATIRAEADLAALPPDLEKTAVRLIHACGMVDIARELVYSPEVGTTARAALAAGRPILCDSEMLAHGITRSRLPADNAVICTLRDSRVPAHARAMGETRSAAAVDFWDPYLEESVVAVGNAPTALFRLLNRLADGAPRPAAVLGFPVGFVGAAESKEALAATPELHFLTLPGRRGGSALAAAAVNALACEQEVTA